MILLTRWEAKEILRNGVDKGVTFFHIGNDKIKNVIYHRIYKGKQVDIAAIKCWLDNEYTTDYYQLEPKEGDRSGK